MRWTRVVVFGCAFAVFGCETAVTPFSTGGSRSDGIVELTYDYGYLQSPVVDTARAQTEALKRCNVWGYSGADPFEGQRSVCDQYGNLGCYHTTVTMKYQCTGNGTSPSYPQVTQGVTPTPPPSAAPMTGQRVCTEQEEAQKRIAIKNGYTMIPNCQ